MSRLGVKDLHRCFLKALGDDVIATSDVSQKSLEVDLRYPLPPKIRLYIYNITDPPGGRTIGEGKIQLIVRGQQRGTRGSFDDSDERIVLLSGYKEDVNVFVFWDAGMYSNFSYSRNVQVYTETINAAVGGAIAEQTRNLRGLGEEIAIAVRADNLRQGILKRIQRTIERISGIYSYE